MKDVKGDEGLRHVKRCTGLHNGHHAGENGNVIRSAGAVGRGHAQSVGLRDVIAPARQSLTCIWKWRLRLYGADIHPCRPGPSPPVAVNSEDVDVAALPQNARP